MSDDKTVRDGRDRGFVNRGEDYEVAFFVEQFMKTRDMEPTRSNRLFVEKLLRDYVPSEKLRRDRAEAYLDSCLNTSSRKPI